MKIVFFITLNYLSEVLMLYCKFVTYYLISNIIIFIPICEGTAPIKKCDIIEKNVF